MDAKRPLKSPDNLAKPGAVKAWGQGGEKLERSASVLLLVDFINPLDFEGAQDLAAPALRAAKMTAFLKQELVNRHIPTIYANDNYGVWHSNFHDVLLHCQSLKGPAGQMAQLLAPAPADLTILKPRHSAFYGTPLELLLNQIEARCIVVAGLSADICVKLTAMDAYLRGYKVWAPSDCTAAETTRSKREALDYMSRVLKADTSPSTSTDLDALKSGFKAGRNDRDPEPRHGQR
jgi:nicotinamidase-related amidase